MANDKVLSQEQIDAMLLAASGGGVKPAATPSPPQAAAPAAPQGVQPMQHVQPAAPQGVAPMQHVQPVPPQGMPPRPQAQPVADGTQVLINKMAERLESLGAAMERIAQLERALNETNTAVRQLQQEFQAMAGQIQLVSSRMEGVLTNLNSTIGYRAQKTFVCNKCQMKGQVAAQIKCTYCNQENWWGWWPQKK